MLNVAFASSFVAMLFSVAVLISVRNYQNRTLDWVPVPIEITSSNISDPRERELGKIWTATINYSFEGEAFTKTVENLPLGANQVFVNPEDPTEVAEEQGPTLRGTFIPIIAVIVSGLFLVVVCLMKFSPTDD